MISSILFCLVMVNMVFPTCARLRRLNIFRNDEPLDGVYIIIFAQSMSDINLMSDGEVSDMADALGAKYSLERQDTYTNGIYGFTATNMTQADFDNLGMEDSVLFVEKDETLSIEPIEKRNLRNTKNDIKSSGSENKDKISAMGGEIIPAGVQRVGWKNVEYNYSIKRKRVFVVDSGLTDSMGEFNVDRNMGRNFVPGENSNNWKDCNGHGTHVSGTIAAKKNNKGVVGVAAGAVVVPVRVLDCTGNGEISTMVQAINYVSQKAKPGDVVNLSIGGPSSSVALDLAVEHAARNTGAKFVVAAGNGGTGAMSYTPARAQGDNVITVCALSANYQTLASFSNYGRPPVDVCAPGTNIVSLSRYGGTKTWSGTSMAAPHVSGVLLLGGSLRTSGTAKSSKDGQSYSVIRI